MPKFGSHIIFAEHALRERPDLFPNVNLNALKFGSIGPDTTLFMFDPATQNPDLRKGVVLAIEVLEEMENVKEKLAEIEAIFSGPVDILQDWFTGGISTDLKYFVNTGIDTLFKATTLGLANGVGTINLNNPLLSLLNNPNLPTDFITDPKYRDPSLLISATDNYGFPFRMFGHPYTEDGSWRQPEPTGDYSNWWWMDLLHYRKTGLFAEELVNNAQGSLEASYAAGYTTHVAGDICGHPFINALTGGPFRNHSYRHLVVETLSDTWLWHYDKGTDVIDSRLDEQINISDDEVEQIANLLRTTMETVYQHPMVPSHLKDGYPKPVELIQAYRLMQRYLKLSTGGGVKRPKAPPNTPKEIIREIKNLLKQASPGSPPNWSGNITDYLKALFAWAAKGFALLIMLATLPAALLTRIASVAPRWALYLLNLGLFYIYSAIRLMVCFVGWGYASKDDFDNFGFVEEMVKSRRYSENDYPFATVPNPKPPFYWLIPPRWHPLAKVEQRYTPPTVALTTLDPSWMIDPANRLDASNRHLLQALAHSPSPADTARLQWELMRLQSKGFGNSVDFSVALLERSISAPDLDLDGDRGFGFRGWEELPPNERFI